MPDSQEIISALEGKGIKLGNYLRWYMAKECRQARQDLLE
jgi:hypothetical protein